MKMINAKQYLLVLLILLQPDYAYNQVKDNSANIKDYIIEYKTIVFCTSDTSYLITQYNYPKGSYEFQLGSADSNKLINEIEVLTGQKVTFKYINSIDTLWSRLPLKYNEYSETIKKVTYFNSDLLNAVKFSFILSKLNLKSMVNSSSVTLRIIDPIPTFSGDFFVDHNSNPKYGLHEIGDLKDYHVFELALSDSDAILYSVKGYSESADGLRIVKNDTLNISRRKFKKLHQAISKLNTSEDVNCRNPGYLISLEINYHNKYGQFMFADLCKKEGLKDVKRLYYLIKSIYIYSQ